MTQFNVRATIASCSRRPVFRFFPVAVLALFLFGVVSVLESQAEPNPSPAEPTPAEIVKRAKRLRVGGDPIDFTASAYKTGVEISLSGLKGRVVLLDFWSTRCAPCIAEMPELKALYADFHDRGLEIIGISLDEDLGVLDDYLEKENLHWPQIADGKVWDSRLAKYYGVRRLPRTFLIGRNGKIVAVRPGVATLRPAIERAVGVKP